MKEKKEKGYWIKRKEEFNSGEDARAKAGTLREQENIPHITMDKEREKYVVRYSVAKWYLEECERVGIKL